MRFLDQQFELLEVERARLDADQVARSLRDDRVAAERLPQLAHVDLERRRGRVRRRAVPELVDQPIARDDPVRVQQQQREQCPLLRAAESHQLAVLRRFERAEDPKLDARGAPSFRSPLGPGKPSFSRSWSGLQRPHEAAADKRRRHEDLDHRTEDRSNRRGDRRARGRRCRPGGDLEARHDVQGRVPGAGHPERSPQPEVPPGPVAGRPAGHDARPSTAHSSSAARR